MKTFGEEIRRLRKQRGKTLLEVSKCVGVSVSYLSEVERGSRMPLANNRLKALLICLGAEERYGQICALACLYRGTIKIKPWSEEEASLILLVVERFRAGAVTKGMVDEIMDILSKEAVK